MSEVQVDLKLLDFYSFMHAKGYYYSYLYDGWCGPKQGQFFSQRVCYEFPGDIRHYLLTGEIRNPKIFDLDPTFSQERRAYFEYVYRKHKDGRLVRIRRVK